MVEQTKNYKNDMPTHRQVDLGVDSLTVGDEIRMDNYSFANIVLSGCCCQFRQA